MEMMLAADITHVNQDAMDRYLILSTPCTELLGGESRAGWVQTFNSVIY